MEEEAEEKMGEEEKEKWERVCYRHHDVSPGRHWMEWWCWWRKKKKKENFKEKNKKEKNSSRRQNEWITDELNIRWDGPKEIVLSLRLINK